ncbi:MAG: isocitrate lyase/phosphoenolpyruvate mutase family protein, partial [Sphingomonadaceae bacterium]
MSGQQEKFDRLRALHDRETAFVIPNPWDAGSARLLTSLGFEALATTSAGYAFSKGKRDSFASLSRREILENAAEIVDATDLPVSADLEDGFGAAPETCAETIRMACKVGLVGGSIEDATGDPDAPIYEISQAVERIRAAAEAARDLPFLLTARA